MPNTDDLPKIRLKCPDLASIFPGRRFLYRAKIGGERQTVTVTASCAPYYILHCMTKGFIALAA